MGDRYRLVEPVGSGGMGVVWRAIDVRDGRLVALKHGLPGEHAMRMRREAAIAAALDHPHVVRFLDLIHDGDQWWLVMEYVPSVSLAELLDRQTRLPPAVVARVGMQVAGALAAMHRVGLVHRDVKPANVLIAEDGNAKLTDFGISRSTSGSDVTLSHTGIVPGTPAYLAPEVANGAVPTAASDVFSLGATLFTAVEGSPPFGVAANPLAVLRRVASGRIPQPRHAGPLAPALGALLRRRPYERPDAARAERLLSAVTAGIVMRPGPQLSKVALVLALVVGMSVAIAADHPITRSEADLAYAVGDPRTVDPCGLVDAEALAGNGTASVDADAGSFNRCDVLLHTPQGDTNVKLELDTPAEIPGPVRTIGAIRVVDQPAESNQCRRTILLPDPYHINVTVRGDIDRCAIANVATASAAQTLLSAGMPRRSTSPAAGSLFWSNACTIMEKKALETLPGMASAHVDKGFGDWICQWTSDTAPLTVLAVFERDQPQVADDGAMRSVNQREVFVKAMDATGCRARVEGRPYTDANKELAVELITIFVDGDFPPDRLCTWASSLAGAVT